MGMQRREGLPALAKVIYLTGQGSGKLLRGHAALLSLRVVASSTWEPHSFSNECLSGNFLHCALKSAVYAQP